MKYDYAEDIYNNNVEEIVKTSKMLTIWKMSRLIIIMQKKVLMMMI